MEVESGQELPGDLRGFIDRLIVPVLVEALVTEIGHLYSTAPSYYDGEGPCADTTGEAA
jgi:hypothetical protein